MGNRTASSSAPAADAVVVGSLKTSASADVNKETSRLAGVEFNTPYSHEVAAVAGLLLVVAVASVALAIKYTKRSTSSNQLSSLSDADALADDLYGKVGKSSWECAPIMTRIGRRHSYESLQQTECRDGGAEARGSFHFSSRLDVANGLLCLYGIRLRMFATKDGQRKLGGWKIAIDIVTQTEVECRQTRLSTQMVQAEAADVPEKTANAFVVTDGGWKSEPMEDVLTVRINQDQKHNSPLRGRLLIRVLGQKPADASVAAAGPTQSHLQLPMMKLGAATFPLERIREPQVASISVTIRNEA